MSGQSDLLELDESARWEHDLAHSVWLLPAPRLRPCPPCAATSRSGQPCNALAVRGDTKCVFHSGRATPRRHQPSVAAAPLVAAVGARRLALRYRSSSAARAFYRAKREGRLTVEAADKIAHELLGEHPAAIWGDAWWDAST